MSSVQVAIVNDQSSGVADSDAKAWTAALQKQVSNDFASAWELEGAELVFVPQGGKPLAGAWAIALLDNSDQAGALGYHDLTPDGLPLGKVFAGTDRQYGETVSVTLSHELLEMLGDPWINLCAQGADGKFYAYEASDAVEADKLGYQIDGVQVSDFVLPAWFGHGAGPYDHLGHLSKPFELAPGGYIGAFDPSSGQGWTQVTAQGAKPTASELFRSLPRIGSRRERRARSRTLWVPSVYEQS